MLVIGWFEQSENIPKYEERNLISFLDQSNIVYILT